MNDWLPALILLADHNGSWHPYLETIYAHFCRDFVQSRPLFRNCRMGLKRYPLEQEKEATFWHLVSEGQVEVDRLPDLRRTERICWPRPMIEQEKVQQLPVWEQERNGQRRIAMSLTDFSYVLILAERTTKTGPMYLPWTAFCVEYNNQRRKLRQEWEKSSL